MADVILKEFVNHNQKALIYSGQHHAFARYHQPIYDYQVRKLWRLNPSRMGNLVYNKIGDRAFNIYLHAPWGSAASETAQTLPMHGVIDQVMEQLGNKRLGFDIRGTPFGAVPDNTSYYSLGYANFTLGTYCDGYIFPGQLKEYQGATIDPLFVTVDNLQDAIDYFPNPTYKKYIKSPEDLYRRMRRDTNFKERFKDVE